MSAPGIRYVPAAVPAADDVLARLLRDVTWSDRMRARRTASFGRPYDYSGQVHAEVAMPPLIAAVAAHVAALAGHGFDNCLANLYPTGRHAMGFHADACADLAPDTWIAIASFGAPRALVFRSADRHERVTLRLAPGSVLLMDHATQRDWTHALPPEDGAAPRVSLTFRQFSAVRRSS